MNRRYAEYLSDRGALNQHETEVEDLEYRYHRLALEAELREIERDGEPLEVEPPEHYEN